MPREVIEPILITERSRERVFPEFDVEILARWMDSVFEIPGTGIRFGLDAIVGLVPGLGDVITSVVSLYILRVASRRGVPRITLMRMASNIAVDYVLGSVPLVGDAFDVYWKANLKNVELLRRHTLSTRTERRKARSGDWLFVGGLMALLIALLVGCVTIAYWIVAGLWRLVGAG
jgi:hypothetical protein